MCISDSYHLSSWIIPEASPYISSETITHSQNTPKIEKTLHVTKESKEEKPELPKETSYDAREDKSWMESVKDFDPTEDLEQLALYETLVERVGVFRWQGPTGLAKGHERSLSHLKAKFQSIKEFGFFIFLHLLHF